MCECVCVCLACGRGWGGESLGKVHDILWHTFVSKIHNLAMFPLIEQLIDKTMALINVTASHRDDMHQTQSTWQSFVYNSLINLAHLMLPYMFYQMYSITNISYVVYDLAFEGDKRGMTISVTYPTYLISQYWLPDYIRIVDNIMRTAYLNYKSLKYQIDTFWEQIMVLQWKLSLSEKSLPIFTGE